eukprot:TRINITY_DN419_c0_g1_i1.p1 TRINITY_DN419_c0_g1~~TRINITY_DN419_c0_g1_i1.p1  ORF type:complete len:476 (+),score=113.44 TRINITY_DN419_c0_g1_i1:79-1506(+)
MSNRRNIYFSSSSSDDQDPKGDNMAVDSDSFSSIDSEGLNQSFEAKVLTQVTKKKRKSSRKERESTGSESSSGSEYRKKKRRRSSKRSSSKSKRRKHRKRKSSSKRGESDESDSDSHSSKSKSKFTPKGRKRKSEKAPRNVKNAYIYFSMDKVKEFQEKHPGMKHKELMTLMGKMWKQGLTDEERQPYIEKEMKDKERYKMEMEKFIADGNLTKGGKKKAPSRAKNAYVCYTIQRLSQCRLENPNLDSKEIMSLMGKEWREMDDADKEPYRKLAKEDSIRYKTEMKEYEGRSSDSSDSEVKTRPRRGYTKTGRKKKSSHAPKRAKNAYVFYSIERHPVCKREHPELDSKAVMSLMGKEWREMDEADKEPYKKLANQDKERYDKEMLNYNPGDSSDSPQERKNGPKRGKSAFMFYKTEKMPELKKAHPQLKYKELLAMIGSEWRESLSTEEKRPYIEKAEEDQQRYKQQLKEAVEE